MQLMNILGKVQNAACGVNEASSCRNSFLEKEKVLVQKHRAAALCSDCVIRALVRLLKGATELLR